MVLFLFHKLWHVDFVRFSKRGLQTSRDCSNVNHCLSSVDLCNSPPKKWIKQSFTVIHSNLTNVCTEADPAVVTQQRKCPDVRALPRSRSPSRIWSLGPRWFWSRHIPFSPQNQAHKSHKCLDLLYASARFYRDLELMRSGAVHSFTQTHWQSPWRVSRGSVATINVTRLKR